jgi:hypothetical protein
MVGRGVEVKANDGNSDGIGAGESAMVGENATGVTWGTGWQATRSQPIFRSTIKP